MDRAKQEEASTMAELGFPASTAVRAGGRSSIGGRDASPDSVIFNVESNISLFSSASASVDRCSVASDVLDRDSLSSETSQHLAGRGSCGRQSLSGPSLDLPETNKATLIHSVNSHLIKNGEIAKVHKLEDNKVPLHFDEEVSPLDSARSSFSIALKERRLRSEAVSKKLERRRPASLDLHNSVSNIVSSSPRFGAMKKNMSSSWKSGNFPSPGTPNYRHGNKEVNKGWSSERVPHHSGAARKQVGATPLPFNNGRTLPSKWEDAERWIFSPGDGVARPSYQQLHRRPKSKSGPLGPPGIAYYSLYSPAIVMYDGSKGNNLIAASPFSAGVLMADASSVRAAGKHENFSRRGEPCIARSVSMHGCTDLVGQSSGFSSQDEKVEDANDTTIVCSAVSRRDMATQMSPVDSDHSSPRRRSSFSRTNHSILPIIELQSSCSSQPEVRDVEIDERVSVSKWPRKNKSRSSSKGSGDIDNWKLKVLGARSSPWDVSERSKSLARATREEAKITAWENLQKAKAEAAMRKLEMKLEKKRSTSMDKIMSKLRSAQRKAQERRNAVLANESNQVSKTFFMPLSLSRTRPMGSLSGCFTCHAF